MRPAAESREGAHVDTGGIGGGVVACFVVVRRFATAPRFPVLHAVRERNAPHTTMTGIRCKRT